MKDYFGYKGKRVVITGAASGMAQAAARMLVDLGAEIYALDVKEVTVPVKKYIKTDLLHKDAIDAAVKQIPNNIYALFNCAGAIPPKFTNVEVTTVNFVGHRHLTERLLPKMNDGGAIAFISSQAGFNWRSKLAEIKPLLDTRSFEEGRAWLDAHEAEVTDGYRLSKLCICAYAKMNCKELAKRLIRINCILPGPSQTGMMPVFTEDSVILGGEVIGGKDLKDIIESTLAASLPLCGRNAQPEEQAMPLVFLNSDMARFITGELLLVDYGYVASVEVGQTPDTFEYMT